MKKERILLAISAEEKVKVLEISKKLDVSMSDFVRKAVKEKIKKEEENEQKN